MREVAGLFLRLGLTAFGGPAVHIAMMREEVVRRRRWMSDQHFLDLPGATNLIPGPNSTEMAIHIGYARAGWPGLIIAGACFIVPAMILVSALAWLYVRYGALPEATAVLYGVKPVVIAIVAQALWGLSRTAVRTAALVVLGAIVLLLYFLGFNEIALLAGSALVAMLAANAGRVRSALVPVAIPVAAAPVVAGGAAAFGLATMFLTFLKIGAVLYGSGYVLLAFLRSDFVVRLDRGLADGYPRDSVDDPVDPISDQLGVVGRRWGVGGCGRLATLTRPVSKGETRSPAWERPPRRLDGATRREFPAR